MTDAIDFNIENLFYCDFIENPKMATSATDVLQ